MGTKETTTYSFKDPNIPKKAFTSLSLSSLFLVLALLSCIDKFVAANGSKEFGATFLRDRTEELANIVSVPHVVSHLIVIHCTCKLITFVNSSTGGLNNAAEGSKILAFQLGGGCQPWSYLNGGGVNPKVKRLLLFSS